MIDKYFEWNIDGIQANTVLEGAEVNIPIEKRNCNNIICSKELRSTIYKFENSIRVYLNTRDTELTKSICEEFNLSYLIKDNSFHIGFDYNRIFNNILKKLKMKQCITTKSIYNKKDYESFVKEIQKEIAFQEHVKEFDPFDSYNKKEDVLAKLLYDNIEKILKCMLETEKKIQKCIDIQTEEEKALREEHKSLSKVENKHIEWKNLMFYTACKSLKIYEESNDERYYNYAKNYYLNVSRDKKCEYPASMKIDGQFFDFKYEELNKRFMKIQNSYFASLDEKLGIQDIETINGSLVPGNEKHTNNNGKNNSKKNKSDSELYNKLQRKIVFYKGLKGKIKCVMKDTLNKDTNYYGFVLNNNYIIYEKFYEKSKDGTNKPAKDSAIYVVTIDVAISCDFDSSKIRKYIEKNHDYKAFRLYHNDTESYQKRVEEVLDYSDISTIKYKELKLLNEKNN